MPALPGGDLWLKIGARVDATRERSLGSHFMKVWTELVRSRNRLCLFPRCYWGIALTVSTSWLVSPSTLHAEDDSYPIHRHTGTPAAPAAPPRDIELPPEAPGNRQLSLYTGIDVVSMYVSRGLIYSDRVSLQPWIELDVPVTQSGPGIVKDVTLFAGNWNSIQPGSVARGETRTGREERLRDWFEADFYSGFRFGVSENVSASVRFNYYTSPSDAFADIHELDARVNYNDAHWWPEAEGFALNPSVRITKATRNRGGPNPWYLEAGLRPGGQLAGLPGNMSLHVPLIFGFGADGQYLAPDKEHHFGFFQTGVRVTAPLNVLPESAGVLTLSGGFDVIAVPDRELNLRGDRTTGVARGGLTYSY
jgi:hypothetical protein